MTWRDGFVGINQTAPTSGLQIQPPDAASIGLRVLGFTSQTANLQEWQNSSGTMLARIDSAGVGYFPTLAAGLTGVGNVYAGNLLSDTGATNPYMNMSASGFRVFNRTTIGNVPFAVRGMASQSGNLQNWEDSAGSVLANIYSDGSFLTPKIYVSSEGVGNSGSFGYASYEPLTGGSRINTSTQTNVALTVRNSHASASGKLQSWQVTTSNTEVASISAAGKGLFTSIGPVSASTFNILDNTGSAVATARTTDFLVNYRLIAGSTTGTESFRTFGNALLGVSNAAHIPVQVRGYTSQTANLQTWEDSAGTVLSYVGSAGEWRTSATFGSTAAGKAYLQPNIDTGAFAFITNNAANKGVVVRGMASQSANLFEAQNSSGTVLSAIDSAGAFVGGAVVAIKLWNRTVQGTGGGSLYLGGTATGSATDSVVLDGNASSFVVGVTSGEWSSLRVGHTNNPNASSTAIHNAIKINPVINYASGGTGSYNALRIAVTETALPSGANYLIHAAAGAAGTTEKFSVTNTGLGTFAGGVALADASDLTIGTTTGSKIGQASSKIGFFNATPVAKPTGVAVDAASIHAALVSLGLISA